MTKYRLVSVETTPAVCAKCGRECPERHLIVVDDAGETMRLGTTCAWLVARVKPTDRIVPPAEPEEIGEMPDWMLGL